MVELGSQLGKGAEVDLAQLHTQRAPLLERRFKGSLHLLVAVELGVAGDSQARCLCGTYRCASGVAAAVRVGGVETSGNAGYLLGVLDGKGKDRDTVQGLAGREQSAVGEPAAGRLEADDIVETGWYPA